jgi:preprotein translocase subunit SecA
MGTRLPSYPPATHSLRAEKKDPELSFLDKAARAAVLPFLGLAASRRRVDAIVPLVRAELPRVAALDDKALTDEARRLGLEVRRSGFRPAAVAPLFAIIAEAADRTIGMRHFDVQFMGGWALLKGMLAEMETGEGKTLTATLAAGVAALAGIPAHVICVNDYLTERDAEEMGPVYRFLGLTVGCVTHRFTQEERRAAYRCDVTYCDNKEITFDYLRDKLVLGNVTGPLRLQSEHLYEGRGREANLLLRGLHFAICDEADSLLVDEARTPLIISGSGEDREEAVFLSEALALAQTLKEDEDYTIEPHGGGVDLTDIGEERVAKATAQSGGAWAGSIRRNDAIRKALTALHVFRPDIHYLVRGGKVQIVDEYTGRLMPDRSWERGIHQLIELKEGCEMTKQLGSLARMTYQRFFRRYLHLCGMTGTAREVRGELWSVYGLNVVRIPTNRPLRRRVLPDRVLPTTVEKDRVILEAVERLHREGRPVLVGTPTVAASERLSAAFQRAGIDHRVLNAKNDREEAGIVAGAGQTGAVIIATNMAGRGTDIKLGPGVADLGGLHVIVSERHDARRIDRQLVGRCARQGDPGSCQAVLSLEDNLVEGKRAGFVGRLAKRLPPGAPFWTFMAKRAIVHGQKKTQAAHARIRRDLLRQDQKMGSHLSFSGRGE